MSKFAKRRTAPGSGDFSLPKEEHGQRKLKQQARQRQAHLKSYGDTMRKEMKSTKEGLLVKLLFLPLAIMLIGSIFMATTIRGSNEWQGQQISMESNKPINDHLSSFKSGKVKQNSIATRNRNQQEDQPLPKWITDYVQWHQEIRAKFPGDELFTNKDAPKLLVRTCLGICGGLHDRLGQLPWDIYLAMRLKRVLLIAWQRPKALENFLLPPEANNDTLVIDWTIPESQLFGFDDIKRVRNNVTELFDPDVDRAPDIEFWATGFGKAMVRAGAPPSPELEEINDPESKFVESKFLRHRLLGHLNQKGLEHRLEREGYYEDESHWKASDLHKAPTFGRIWKLFFRPSPEVRAEIVDAMEKMGLLPPQKGGESSPNHLPPTIPYNAVHCRVRHPKAHPVGEVMKGKNANYPADKTGLPWEVGGPQRAFALETADKALTCSREIGQTTDETSPVYFLSDSNDLVNHVAVELADSSYLKEHGSNSSWVNPELLETVRSQKVVARDATMENAHIDRQKGRPPESYYGTFVDLYIAMKAKCVIYGIGYYAAFAAKISGTDCAYLYAKETWGAQVEKSAKICPNTQ